MTPNESTIPTETTDTNRTDEQSTDHDGGRQAVAAAVTAREMLQDVDPETVDDDQESHLINALEALDNLFIEASPEELGEAFSGEENVDDEVTGRSRETRPTEVDGRWSIPQSIDDIPKIEAPTDKEREHARLVYGADLIPDDGPIPDPRAFFEVPVDVHLPEWLLTVTANRLETRNNPSREDVRALLYDYVTTREEFRAAGRDAIDVILTDVDQR